MSHSSSDRSPSLLDRVRALCQRKGYSYRTEQTYARWIVRYVKYHDLTHPRDLEKQDVRDYLSYLATERSLAASTQNQALNALLFLHRDVLDAEWDAVSNFERAKEPERIPVVRTQEEVKALSEEMNGSVSNASLDENRRLFPLALPSSHKNPLNPRLLLSGGGPLP